MGRPGFSPGKPLTGGKFWPVTPEWFFFYFKNESLLRFFFFFFNKHWILILKQFSCVSLCSVALSQGENLEDYWQVIIRFIFIKTNINLFKFGLKCMTNYYFPIIYIVPLISIDGQASPRLFIAPEMRHKKSPIFLPPSSKKKNKTKTHTHTHTKQVISSYILSFQCMDYYQSSSVHLLVCFGVL